MARAAVISFPNFRRVDASLKALNINTGALYRSLNISPDALQEGGSSVSIPLYLELLNRAAEENDMPFLGIHIAQGRTVADHGMLGYMMRNAPDFESCLNVLESYVDLVIPGARARVLDSEDECIWTYSIPGYSAGKCRHEVELSLMQLILAVRELLDLEDWRPSHVFLSHDAPEDVDPLRDAMSDRLIFNHHFSGVAFPRQFLERRLSDADPDLLHILEQQVQRSMGQFKLSGKLLERLTFLISSQLGNIDISSAQMAAYLGMSRRTLVRRLADQGTSFSKVRSSVVSQIAREALSTTSVRITELAQRLGYSDASAFDRAFRKENAMSPLQYRRQHRNR